jgi:hypothetical protein
MVHGIAEQLGGRLRIESQKGKGTAVEIWLPLAHGEMMVPVVAETAPTESVTRPLVIVVVDDDALVLTKHRRHA